MNNDVEVGVVCGGVVTLLVSTLGNVGNGVVILGVVGGGRGGGVVVVGGSSVVVGGGCVVGGGVVVVGKDVVVGIEIRTEHVGPSKKLN